MLNSASVPAICASPPEVVVCVCLFQTATVWKMARMPIRPIVDADQDLDQRDAALRRCDER